LPFDFLFENFLNFRLSIWEILWPIVKNYSFCPNFLALAFLLHFKRPKLIRICSILLAVPKGVPVEPPIFP
jgi:hypothetical protein